MKVTMFVFNILLALGVLYFAEETGAAPQRMERSELGERASEESREGSSAQFERASGNSELAERASEDSGERSSAQFERAAGNSELAERASEESGEGSSAQFERAAGNSELDERAAREDMRALEEEEDVGDAEADGSTNEVEERSQQNTGNARAIITGPRIVVGAFRKVFKKPSDS